MYPVVFYAIALIVLVILFFIFQGYIPVTYFLSLIPMGTRSGGKDILAALKKYLIDVSCIYKIVI